MPRHKVLGIYCPAHRPLLPLRLISLLHMHDLDAVSAGARAAGIVAGAGAAGIVAGAGARALSIEFDGVPTLLGLNDDLALARLEGLLQLCLQTQQRDRKNGSGEGNGYSIPSSNGYGTGELQPEQQRQCQRQR